MTRKSKPNKGDNKSMTAEALVGVLEGTVSVQIRGRNVSHATLLREDHSTEIMTQILDDEQARAVRNLILLIMTGADLPAELNRPTNRVLGSWSSEERLS